MPATQPHQDDRCYLVTRGDNPLHLPVQTRLQVVRQHEKWTHHGCIPSIRDVMLEAQVLDGPRSGEVVDILLEWGYEDGPPWGVASWLVEAGQGNG